MPENPLKVVAVDSNRPETKSTVVNRATRKQELQARFERLWLIDPEQFNSRRDCMERERIGRIRAGTG